MTDAITKSWIRNVADERAAANGCWFDPEVGGWTVYWIERFCRLYEGEWAGEPLVLRGCHECNYDIPPAHEWPVWDEGGSELAVKRAEMHAACHAAGHRLDWQYEVVMRIFGWQRNSQRWGRPIRRFTDGSIFVPKKNKKSPSLAAIGLYLLCGDGEQGGKVFFGAKDGSQAREIAGKHAVEMVGASADLSSQCEINKTEMRITHFDSRSFLKPLSSSNASSQKSKEGLNGSMLVDETHVVDRDFIGRVSRMGISRSEPLHLEFSTAGDDPESYGHERFEYGQQVNEGKIDNEQIFYAAYCAPADLTDVKLAEDPIKWGMLANPAWGHTVHEEEYIADYNKSKASIDELARFKMYRLNIWQKTTRPWLRADHWEKCYKPFTEDDLLALPCWMGLDLSRTRDMSSVVLVFKSEEEYYQLPFFWMPENEAVRQKSKAAFTQWHAAGQLYYCPHDTIDQRIIYRKIEQLADRFDIRAVAYDQLYAEEITRDIEDNLNIERVAFRQTFTEFASPTADYERLVIEGKLHHNGHAVLTWQAGHVHVKTDANNNKRPVKPGSDNHKKIDGIVAGVMGLREAVLGDIGSTFKVGDSIFL